MAATRDHTVPRMYLKQFASGKKDQIVMRRMADVTKSFRPNITNATLVEAFYWGRTKDGTQGHQMEKLLSDIEDKASPVFQKMLRNPAGAVPSRWPLQSEDDREALARWMAAQVVRTTRQRKRIAFLKTGASVQGDVLRDQYHTSNHLDFMNELLDDLTAQILSRPWGFGFSKRCLITSDAPVVIANDHDHPDQLAAFSYWDVILPLDPHRLLFLPSYVSSQVPTDDVETDFSQNDGREVDHLFALPSDGGDFINQLVFDAADQMVLNHPDHDGFMGRIRQGKRLREPWNGDADTESTFYSFSYDAIPIDSEVPRWWEKNGHEESPEGITFDSGDQFRVDWEDDVTIYTFSDADELASSKAEFMEMLETMAKAMSGGDEAIAKQIVVDGIKRVKYVLSA